MCMAVAGPAMFATARDAGERLVEFRLDSLEEPAAAVDELRACLAARPEMMAVATCRRKAFGGAFLGSAREQIAILVAAAQAGCALVDIEVETAEELGEVALETLRAAGAAVIVSWHDFTETPDLEAVYARMQPFAPDLYKLVPTAGSLRDSLRVIDLLERHGGSGNVIAMAMGFKGMLTRVVGPRYGSVFTFAAAHGRGGTAPGQVSVRTMRELYRVDAITTATAIYGVAGEPVTGSMSPLMHNTAFAATGMDAVYLPLETADVAELMDVVERLGVRGLSVTMPLKEAVMPLLQHADASVRAMGACNTLLRYRDGALAGFNTDVRGIVAPLERRMALQGARVLVLGAGGAARAAVYGLRERGAQVWVMNRTETKAQALAETFGAHVQMRAGLARASFDAMVNATPYGMRGRTMEAPVTQAEMNCRVFFDTVYNPTETPLIRAAQGRGVETIPGVAMFVEQGVRQFELWTERDAPEGDMAEAVVAALEAEG